MRATSRFVSIAAAAAVTATAAGAVVALADPVGDAGAPASMSVPAPYACRAPGSTAVGSHARSARDPVRIRMSASSRARGASGTMVLRLGASPFGVAVEPDGSYRYHLEVELRGLRERDDLHHVVWAATPELDEHRRIGAVSDGEEGRVEGTVTWNKFLVFVTAEETPRPDSWSGRILLSALSPSGRMHTMAGHGPFSGEPCLDPRQ